MPGRKSLMRTLASPLITDYKIMTLKQVQGDVLKMTVVSASCRPDNYWDRHPSVINTLS